MKKNNIAIVLAAGRGKRMNSNQPKQYLLLNEKPILYYSLETFEKAASISAVIIVVGKGEKDYIQKQFVDRYGFQKVCAIVEGGKERYHSVYNGIESIINCDYVCIHDGARPFVDEAVINRGLLCAEKYDACVVGMPVKDTVKIADEKGYIADTPNRSRVWAVQTPQIFEYHLVKYAYEQLLEKEQELLEKGISITDDAMVVETFTDKRVRLVEGNYKNIKITTPEDLQIANVFLQNRE